MLPPVVVLDAGTSSAPRRDPLPLPEEIPRRLPSITRPAGAAAARDAVQALPCCRRPALP